MSIFDHRGSKRCPCMCIAGITLDPRGLIGACGICKLVHDPVLGDQAAALKIVRSLLEAVAVEHKVNGGTVASALGRLLVDRGLAHDLAAVAKEAAQERADDLEQALDALVAEVEAALPSPKRKGLKVALTAANKVLGEV